MIVNQIGIIFFHSIAPILVKLPELYLPRSYIQVIFYVKKQEKPFQTFI